MLHPNDVDERCGLILEDGSLVEIENIAEDKANSYRMNPEGVLNFVDHMTGTWHTHPDTDPNLSGEDYAGFLAWPNLDHFIIGRRNGEVVVLKYQVKEGLVIACD